MRNEVTLTLEDRSNPDKPRQFLIREMSATRCERFLYRAALVIAGSGINTLPDEGGINAAAKYLMEHGAKALGNIDFDKAEPLLNELLGCCSVVVDKAETKLTPENVDTFIWDVPNLVKLRLEALKLNLGFFKQGIGNVFGSPENPNT